jgi:predicted O-methyltransferase YrrM
VGLFDALPAPFGGRIGALWRAHVVNPALRRYGAADTEALLGGRPAHSAAQDVIAQLLPEHPPLATLHEEFDEVDRELGERARAWPAVFPESYRMEREGRRLLYLLVRLTRPRQVVETGVANGMSTVVLLHALAKNGIGRLRSLDVTDAAGGLLSDDERAGWELGVVHPTDRSGLDRALAGVDAVDLFLHDSKHSYEWQRLEYSTAARLMPHGGLLVSDDVDASYAWIEFTEQRGLASNVLFDGRKFVGAAVLPALR